MPQNQSGPSLETYIETRFNLLMESLKAAISAQTDTLRMASDAQQSALGSSIEAGKAAQMAADIRYQQRFEAQSDALSAAFLSQQTAMKTAFDVAEKAVNAALAAADRAVAKAEAAADKRFEALNELRQMLNDMMTSLMPRKETEERFNAITEKIESTNIRIGTLDNRITGSSGEQAGGRRSRDDSRLYIGLAIAILMGLLGVISLALRFVKP